MITFPRRIRITSWPIWAKLLVGFAIAILIPTVLLLMITFNSFKNTNRDNVVFYLNEIGSRQRPALNSIFNQVAGGFRDFTSSYSFGARTLLMSTLDSDNTGDTGDMGDTQRTLEIVLARNLLDLEDVYLEEAWMLDKDGQVVLSNTTSIMQSEGIQPRYIPGNDASNSPAYLYAQNNFEVYQRDWDFVVYSLDGQPQVEIIEAIYDINFGDDREVVGYLVASLNVSDSIFPILQFRSKENLSVRSYLVDDNSRIIATDPVVTTDSDYLSSDAVKRAFANERGVDTFRFGENRGAEVISYYTPLSIIGLDRIRFILVTEINSDITTTQVSSALSELEFPLVVGLLALTGILVLLFYQLFAPPLSQLLQAIRSMATGNYDIPVPAADRGDEFGKVATAFIDMRQQVNNLVQDFSLQMTKRERDVAATQEISRFAAAERDLQTLMDKVVDLIVDRFSSIYHAQVFLVDRDRQYALLRASTGEAGRKLLERGHRLAVGSTSVIGRVIEEGRVIVARDTATSDVHRRNEFLPETRAELAIPLQIGDNVIGALDVQSKQNDSFTEDHINVFHTMADQIAIAIQNAQLYQESIQRLEEIETTNRQTTRQAWKDYMLALRQGEISSVAGVTTDTDASDLRREAIARGEVVIGKRTDRQTVPIAIPIKLRGEPLGAVEWELPAETFDSNKVLLAQELVNRLAISLDNVRLFQQSQQATERERLVNTIAARLTQQTAINDILETAVREVGQALRSPQVAIRLGWDEDSSSANGDSSPMAEVED